MFKCLKVRAFADNVKEMKDAMKAIKCENVANFTSGFEYAFEILHRVGRFIFYFYSEILITYSSFFSTTNLVKEVNVIRR